MLRPLPCLKARCAKGGMRRKEQGADRATTEEKARDGAACGRMGEKTSCEGSGGWLGGKAATGGWAATGVRGRREARQGEARRGVTVSVRDRAECATSQRERRGRDRLAILLIVAPDLHQLSLIRAVGCDELGDECEWPRRVHREACTAHQKADRIEIALRGRRFRRGVASGVVT